MNRQILAAVVTIAILGCSTPTTRVEAVDLRPTLSISQAPAGSILLINGIAVADAHELARSHKAIVLSSGSHLVTITQNGKAILQEKIYLGEGINKTLGTEATQ